MKTISRNHMEYIFLSNDTIAFLICFKKENRDKISVSKLKSIISQDVVPFHVKTPNTFVGPKLSYYSSWGSNAKRIITNCDIPIERIEKYRFWVYGEEDDSNSYDPLLEKIYTKETFHQEFEETSSLSASIFDVCYVKISDSNFEKVISEMGLCFDEQDIEYYSKLFSKQGREPTNLELIDLSESNCEHSRHHFFKGRITIDGIQMDKSLFDLVKETNRNSQNSIKAFCDNASVICDSTGKNSHVVFQNENGKYSRKEINVFPTFTAETHNFPTLISPFQGAATGVGGRIRDTFAVGRGGIMIAGTAGYCTKNQRVMVEASNGASDYGNKIGEPIILGFARIDPAWEKPVMFTGGFGQIQKQNVEKLSPQPGDFIVKVGGPAFRVGIGGGSASSRTSTNDTKTNDFSAVQRGDPEMGNKLYKFLLRCIELGERNPIISLHDQGAGGTANVTKEIVADGPGCGAQVFLNRITCGDKTLSVIEKWISEYQEQMTMIIRSSEELAIVEQFAKEEHVSLDVIGTVNDSGIMNVYADETDTYPFEHNEPVFSLPLKDIVDIPRKNYNFVQEKNTSQELWVVHSEFKSQQVWKEILSDPSVGSKRFLVNKVDRHVTGKVVQQQCVGPYHTPISDYSLVLHSLYSSEGIAGTIGERHFNIWNSKEMASMVVGEMLTNLGGVVVSCFTDIKCQANWMWPEKSLSLVHAVDELSKTLQILGIGIDGGKDSLSMRHNGIVAPGTLVLSSYTPVPDIREHITPEFKEEGNTIYFIDLAYGNQRLGSSVYYRHFLKSGSEATCEGGSEGGFLPPRFEKQEQFRHIFETIQKAIVKDMVVSIHDRSDGGLFTTIAEMSIASGLGCDITTGKDSEINIPFLFNEELGWIIEVQKEKVADFVRFISCELVDPTIVYEIGFVSEKPLVIIDKMRIPLDRLGQQWEKPSREMEELQTNPICVSEEYDDLYLDLPPKECIDNLTFSIPPPVNNPKIVGIFRAQGSNGENEMAAAFDYVGFQTIDLTFDILLKDPNIIDRISGIAFVGGFTYMDVLGAGRGVSETIKYNPKLIHSLKRFYSRDDTFSLGICNGCQFMIHLNEELGIGLPNVYISKNPSGRFESRYTYLRVSQFSKSKWTEKIVGKTLGVWTAFGEGCLTFNEKDPNGPIETGTDTFYYHSEEYPYNPGNSTWGLAGVCSRNGRHVAMMPHPERTFLNCQIPWIPNQPKRSLGLGPWSLMFSAFI